MSNMLKPEQNVQTELSGVQCSIEDFLGGGTQGEVYKAKVGGKPMALKWYLPASANNEQRTVIKNLIAIGPPNAKFLWPIDIVTSAYVDGFGYIMQLRESKYKCIVDLLDRSAEPTFRALAISGFQLAHSYLQLHSQGLCYRDISHGNVFFDPNTGDVLICDNDNVVVNGQPTGNILGTPRFMAPEIVSGEKSPSRQTDLYSLAVLLFYMFMVHHPLEGKLEADIKCLDLPAMNKLYGTNPVFIFDPDDESNRPVPGYQDNAIIFWKLYPDFLLDLFARSFTVGLHDPDKRIQESEWRLAMTRLRDSIIYCSSCGRQNMYDSEKLKSSQNNMLRCWACDREIVLPFRMRINRNIVMLNYDTQLFYHHIDRDKMYDFSAPVAEVARHPTDSTIWGLRNLTGEKWVVTTAEGRIYDVDPGRSCTLSSGIRINFGKMEGEIRY